MSNCTVCGKELLPNAAFCSECGTPVVKAVAPSAVSVPEPVVAEPVAAEPVAAEPNVVITDAPIPEANNVVSLQKEAAPVPDVIPVIAPAAPVNQFGESNSFNNNAYNGNTYTGNNYNAGGYTNQQAPVFGEEGPVIRTSQRDEIAQLPPQYRPLNMWAYFGLEILMWIPVIGFILTFVFAFAPKNVNIKNFARSRFCYWIIAGVFTIVLVILGFIFWENIKELIGSLGSEFGNIIEEIIETFEF